jgi:hypothetical protein
MVETGLNQNYNRDYDPAVGRYVESDPIGLAGGVNTYAYVGSEPTGWIDPYGLCDKKCGLVKAPEYDVQGSVPAGTTFHWTAKFANDATHDPKCCEVRQQVSWDHGSPPHGGFQPPDNLPNNWYEDRDTSGTRYGRRSGSYSAPTPNWDWYGPNDYNGADTPSGSRPGFVLNFRLTVVDVCNGDKTIFTSKPISVEY